MRRGLGLCCSLLASFGVAAATVPVGVSAEAGASVSCARTYEGVPSASQSEPCWEAVHPYPFGSEGEPCAAGAPSSCFLTVTSMAFRAWNRGLAATAPPTVPGQPTNVNNPYGVWIFNGTHWYPDPTFPGSNSCPGHVIVWAGKLDYWLIGGPSGRPWYERSWAPLCRFDGTSFAWEPLEIPKATIAHVTPAPEPTDPHPEANPGGITSGACLAWNNCWFFGTYGVVLHWNGERLSDATPNSSERWLHGEYTGAVARENALGSTFGAAVGATSEYYAASKLLPAEPSGAPPPELFGSDGNPFSPLLLEPLPTTPQNEEPYRTDLVAVDYDSEGQGWVAGDPAGLRGKSVCDGPCQPPPERSFSGEQQPQPAPLLPVSASGQRRCSGPATERFAYTPSPSQIAKIPSEREGVFLWSSIATIPSTGEALAGGLMRPRAPEGPGTNEDGEDQPVIVRARCDGTSAVTRFRVEDTTARDFSAPGDREGTVTAIAASAPNDAWAATSEGRLSLPPTPGNPEPPPAFEEPRLYRLTNGLAPDAPEGNDLETRPLPVEEPPIFVFEPPLPEPSAPAPSVVAQSPPTTLPPTVYDLRSKLHHHGRAFNLYLSFKLRRPITLGAQGLRHGRVVSEAHPRYFAGRQGLLVLKLSRGHWPTEVRLIS